MEDIAKRFVEWGTDRWHSASGLVAVLIGTAGLSVVILTGLNVSQLSTRQWLGISVLLVGVSIFWWKTHIKRVRAKRIGLGVAIFLEDPLESRQLRSDFVETLKQLLTESRLRTRFEFIEFSQTLSKRVAYDDQAALWLSGKSNVTFLIYGRARVRDAKGTKSHVMDLKWAVRHAPIAAEQSTKLASDADALFPRRWILESGNLFTCEFAAQFTDAVARYVIGCAALVSGEHEYAEDMLLDAERRLDSRIGPSATKAVVLGRVRSKVAENYWEWAQGSLNRYTFRSRDKQELNTAEPILEKLRKYDPNNYSARQSLAMIAFLLRRDLNGARAEIERCRGEEDGTWRYNEAFLLAYEGDLDSGYRAYSRAFESPLGEPTVPTQSEEFIQLVIDEEPERVWLYFCTGIINYRAKGDLLAARHDLQKFRDSADPIRFAKQLDVAARWLEDINRRLDLDDHQPPN